MSEALTTLVDKVRSKNTGPFWLTVDVFCGNEAAFTRVVNDLKTQAVAKVFAVAPGAIHRFDIAALNVVKFTLPRPQIQGAIDDRDIHGASWAALLGEIEI